MKLETIKTQLERVEFSTMRTIPNKSFKVFNEPTFYKHLENEMNALTIELRDYVWAEKLQDETVTIAAEISYPSDWWQHLKQRWFPRWALQRWPVLQNHVTEARSHRFRTVAMFPEFRYRAPSGMGPVIMRTLVD